MASKEDIEGYCNFVLSIIQETGKLFLESQNEDIVVENKTDHELVTEYDRKIEELLVDKIKAKYPNHKFIGEESSNFEKQKPILTDEPTWIIDPIDGTTNFTKKLPFCGTSVGLLIKQEQILGIISIPYLNELYTAIKGQGAYLNGKRIHVSKVEEPKKSVFGYEISVASRSEYYHSSIMGRLQVLVKEVLGIRCLGCPIISQCYVASGKIDAYQCEGLYPWDVAAGTLLVKEAGGHVIDLSGGPLDLLNPNVLCTSTKKLSEKLLEIERRAHRVREAK